jgi:hypothetical protein
VLQRVQVAFLNIGKQGVKKIVYSVLNQHLSWFRTANYVERRGLVEIRARGMGRVLHVA